MKPWKMVYSSGKYRFLVKVIIGGLTIDVHRKIKVTSYGVSLVANEINISIVLDLRLAENGKLLSDIVTIGKQVVPMDNVTKYEVFTICTFP